MTRPRGWRRVAAMQRGGVEANGRRAGVLPLYEWRGRGRILAGAHRRFIGCLMQVKVYDSACVKINIFAN